jgi:hypothetical protein
MTITATDTQTEAIHPNSVPAHTEGWTEPERLLAFLMLLQDFVKAGINVRVRTEFLPATEEQHRKIKAEIEEFLKAFPDPRDKEP